MGRLLATFGVAAFLATKAAVFAKTNGITDGFVTLGKPLELYITADHAWASTASAAPVSGGS